jgi:uncharacterized protein
MERLYDLVVNRHRAVLAALLLATVFFARHAIDIRFDGSVESLLPGDDPGIRYYAGVRETFGSDEVGVIGVLADDVLAKPVLETIDRLTKAIEALDGVEKVVSLTNARDPVVDVIEPPLLVPEFPTAPEELEELRAKVADRPIYRKNLFAEDMRAAAINVFFREMSDDEYLATGVDERILEAIEAERGELEIHYTGLPHLKTYSVQAMQRDLLRFVPATLALIVLVLAVAFRSVRGIVLPALTVILSLTWTLGIMSLAGVGLSLGTMALPPLVLVLGTAYSVHVVAEYYELAGTGRDRTEVVHETLRRTGFPLVIAGITTIAGFASLGVNSIQSIRQMGIYSSVGISLAFVFSLVLVPSLLLVLPLRTRGGGGTEDSPGLERWLERIGRFSISNRRLIAIGAVGAALACIGPIARIQVDSNFLSFFEEDDPIRLATDAINQRLVGATAFYVVVDGSEAGTFKKWESLKRLKDFQIAVDRLPGVERTISFVDYAEMLDRGSQSSTSGEIVVGPDGEIVETPAPVEITSFWQKPERIGAVLSLVASSPDTFSSVVSPDFSRTNLIVRTSLAQSSDINATADRIAEIGRRTFPMDLEVHPTGNLLLLTKTTGDIVVGQAQSLALTAGVIFAVMSAMFLSFRVGVIAMIPNLFPILVFFALLGLSGSALNFGTNIIASIALGVGVDETIHLMSRLSAEVRATGNQERALLATLTTVGKPALYASCLLFFGFLVLSVSTFVPIQEFGWLSAVTIVVGTASELVLLPALLATTKIITLWDVLYLKLGPEPHRTIPLFASLRPMQAKIVALMASLRSYPAGTPVVRQGDVGQEMFVIINGRADVFVNVNGHAQRVRGLGRGDVFGEMGLIRRHERTADVISTQDLEVMAMNEQMLTRVQRRYPRTANKILVNLARILSDRLQDETQRAASRR